jgi:hypothetical protein
VFGLSADCYVTKPVGMDQLATIVRSIDDFWFTVVRHPADEPWDRSTDAGIRIPLHLAPLQANGPDG